MSGYELPDLRYFSESLKRVRCWYEADKSVQRSAEIWASLKGFESTPRWHNYASERALASLGDDLLSLLVELRGCSDFASQRQSNNSEERIREAARSMLACMIETLSGLNVFLGIGADFSPLMSLERALDDLSFGQNNKLLVIGELSDQLGRQCFSELGRVEIRAHSAVMIELLLTRGYERRQLAAAGVVTKILRRAGYVGANNRFASADTVKRWHNRARKPVSAASTRTRNKADGLLRMLYASLLFQFDPKVGAYRHPSHLLHIRVFDPNLYADFLEARCNELRIPNT